MTANASASLQSAHNIQVRIERVDSVSTGLPADESWLSVSETGRVAQLRAPRRRQQYLAGHWLLRQLLAERLGGHAADWPLLQRTDLPPQLQGAQHPQLSLSISHSGEWIAVAVASRAIGIDLEQYPRRHSLAQVAHLLGSTDPAEVLDDDALLRRWVAKEAFVKRDAGAALPERLAELRLLAADPAAADVRLWSGASFHLAVAASAPLEVSLDCPDRLQIGEAWQVVDHAAS